MNFEMAMAIQRACTGENVELAKGTIAEHAVEIDKWIEGMNAEKAERCKAFYEEMISDKTTAVYNADALMDEIRAQEKKFKNFVFKEDKEDQFLRMQDATEELLMNSPFIGMDTVAYGIAECCIIAQLEFFTWKKLGLDHDLHRNQYYDALVNMTEGVAVADYWIKVYDELQKRFETFGTDFENDRSFQVSIIACALVALAAMKDHDEYSLDFASGRAVSKAEEIMTELENDDYDEGLSDIVDNAVAMHRFVYTYFIEE